MVGLAGWGGWGGPTMVLPVGPLGHGWQAQPESRAGKKFEIPDSLAVGVYWGGFAPLGLGWDGAAGSGGTMGMGPLPWLPRLDPWWALTPWVLVQFPHNRAQNAPCGTHKRGGP